MKPRRSAALALALLSAYLALPGCTASQGRTAAEAIRDACQGGMIVTGEVGWVPLCVAPELVEKFVESINPPTVHGARVPLTRAQIYAKAKELGARPIVEKKP